MRRLIVGYSFRDPHVNEVIVDGIRSSGLKLFIIDPKSPMELRRQLALGRYGDIWKGIHAHVSRPLSEVFGRSRHFRLDGPCSTNRRVPNQDGTRFAHLPAP
jgi:hypothetical protein